MINKEIWIAGVWGVVATLSCAYVISACKGSNSTTEVKSLDNFVRSPSEVKTINHCGIDYAGEPLPEVLAARVQAVTTPNTPLLHAVIGVLKSVPENLARPFFAVGGKIIVTPDAPSLCADVLTEAEREFAGAASERQRACWRQAQVGAAPEIVLAASEADIHHSLVRMFAYVFSDLFIVRAELTQDPAFASQEWRQGIAGFKEARYELASALLSDLETSHAHETAARLEGFREQAGDRFEGFIAAEAVDSYYCSVASRAKFKEQFPKTYAAFTSADNPHALVHQFGAPRN